MTIRINVAPEKYLEAAEALKSVAAIRAHGLSLSTESVSTLKSVLQEIIDDVSGGLDPKDSEESNFCVKAKDGSVIFGSDSNRACSTNVLKNVIGQCRGNLLVVGSPGEQGEFVPWHRIKHVVLHDW